jgi:hypothetical protein
VNHVYNEYTQNCPPGLYRLFVSSPTQIKFNLRTDEDVTQEDPIRMVAKQALLDDITAKMAISDFSPLKKLIEEYPEDEILFLYDYDFNYDKNFYLCLTTDLKAIIDNVSEISQ